MTISDLTALDETMTERDTYRAAWLKAEARADYYYEQCQRLKGLTGRGEVLYAGDVCKLANVSKHTLNVWPKRYPEGSKHPFPKARMEGNRRTWDRAEVMEWLRVTGRQCEEES